MNVPRNFLRLHDHEEAIFKSTVASLEGNADDVRNLEVIDKAIGILQILSVKAPSLNQDQLTIQLLGIRVSNALVACIRLLLSGYSQCGVMVLRDAFETALLIDYLHLHPEKIPSWRSAPERLRKQDFAAIEIRFALDERDNDQSRRRQKLYQTLCELGAHPTYKGITLTRAEDGEALWGPFAHPSLLSGILWDVSRISMECAFILGRHVEPQTPDYMAESMSFYEAVSVWMQHALGRPHDAGAFDSVRNDLRAYKALYGDESFTA